MVIDCVAGDGHVDGTAQYCSGALPGTRPPPGFVMKVSVLHGHQAVSIQFVVGHCFPL